MYRIFRAFFFLPRAGQNKSIRVIVAEPAIFFGTSQQLMTGEAKTRITVTSSYYYRLLEPSLEAGRGYEETIPKRQDC
ncbi:hypothetical protein TGAM01_v200208 [Trichoderma gamsii]|uniref:Uncharacterized protein n=1 Tax=Trichoderma gamsii TaxID=398673 RepID=A0A2P5A2L3_9HYPO|nr:hypothetical protein TGAM01_v200208 [Trichoderma gamsii]PON30788.1 hypothetical protein TGAM01_v200208 [Trichoderma gamsii]